MQYRNRISIDRICVGAVSRMRGLHEFGKYNPFALSSKRGFESRVIRSRMKITSSGGMTITSQIVWPTTRRRNTSRTTSSSGSSGMLDQLLDHRLNIHKQRYTKIGIFRR